MDPSSFLDQIDRLSRENERETDPALKKENGLTIKHLHKQYRKATKHRPLWFGFARIVFFLILLFLLALWVSVALVKHYGWAAIWGAGGLTLILFVFVTMTALFLLKKVSPELYQTTIRAVLDSISRPSK